VLDRVRQGFLNQAVPDAKVRSPDMRDGLAERQT
jgi:hypothetical protein